MFSGGSCSEVAFFFKDDVMLLGCIGADVETDVVFTVADSSTAVSPIPHPVSGGVVVLNTAIVVCLCNIFITKHPVRR